MRKLIFIPFLLSSHYCLASDFNFNIGARLQISQWHGNNTSNGNYQQGGSRIGTTLSIRAGKFFSGINLIRGDYKFDGKTPDRPSGVTPSAPVTVLRNDVDLVFGYQVHPRFAPTIALKSIVNEWVSDGYRAGASGLGIGLALNQPIRTPLHLYGNISLFVGPAHINDAKFGKSGGTSLEIGLSYQIKNTAFSGSLMSQGLLMEFDNGNKLEYAVGGLSFGVQHRF